MAVDFCVLPCEMTYPERSWVIKALHVIANELEKGGHHHAVTIECRLPDKPIVKGGYH